MSPLISAANPSMVFVIGSGLGLLVLGFFVFLFFVFLIYLMVCLRRYWEIVDLLKQRFLAKSDMPAVDWVRCGPIQLAFSKPSVAGGGPDQLMACSPLGLCWRTPEMFTLCIPWESIKLVSHSRFGFFRADFIIEGFADNRKVYISLESTDPQMGMFIEQCSSAIGGGRE